MGKETEGRAFVNRRTFLYTGGLALLSLSGCATETIKARGPELLKDDEVETPPALEMKADLSLEEDHPIFDRYPGTAYELLSGVKTFKELDRKLVERVKVLKANSYEELNDVLWKDYPNLYEELKENRANNGVYFDNPEFREKYIRLRNERDKNVIRGVIVMREGDVTGNARKLVEKYTQSDVMLEETPLVALEQLSFGLWEQMLSDMREDGYDVPDQLQLTVVKFRNDLLDGEIKHEGPEADRDTIIPVDSRNFADVVFWPPSYDWIIYESQPLTNGIAEKEITIGKMGKIVAPFNVGWNHEQNHLLGTMDLYRFWLQADQLLRDGDGNLEPVERYLKGWEKHGLWASYFGVEDIMHDMKGYLSPVSALQIALSRRMGIRSTMVDGYKEYRIDPSFIGVDLSIETQSGRKFKADHLNAFGEVYDHRDKAKIDDKETYKGLESRTIPLGDGFTLEDFERTYMYGFDLEGVEFSFPIPNQFLLLFDLAKPDGPTVENDIYKFKIILKNDYIRRLDAIDLPKGYTKILRVSLMRGDDLRAFETDKTKSRVLATAEVSVDPKLMTGKKYEKFYMVWYVDVYDPRKWTWKLPFFAEDK